MTYRFGDFSLDERTRQLRRGNQRLQLRAKCFDALQFLVRHANATVTKSQFIDALWHNREADEASLTQLVYELRRLLGDVNGELIVTLPSVGYRFTPEVHVDEPRGSSLERYVEPVNVYELYAKGMFLLEKPGKARFWQALQLFQRAAELMPCYSPAYLGLAHAWITMGCSIYVHPRLAFPNGRAAAEQALKLDETLAEAYALLANVALFYHRDWPATAQFASRALAMNPSLPSPHQALAWMHIATGNLDEATKIAIKTIEMMPASLPLQVILAQIYRYRGEVKKSTALLRSIVDMDRTFDLARYYLANCLISEGLIDEALAELERVAQFEPTAQVLSAIAYAFAVKGERSKAEDILRGLRIEAQRDYVSPFPIAIIYAGLRDYDAAMRELYQAVEEQSPWLIFLGVEFRFDAMRGRHDFQQLLVEAGVRSAAA